MDDIEATSSDIDDIPSQHYVTPSISNHIEDGQYGKKANPIESMEKAKVVEFEHKGENKGHTLMSYSGQYTSKLSNLIHHFGASMFSL